MPSCPLCEDDLSFWILSDFGHEIRDILEGIGWVCYGSNEIPVEGSKSAMDTPLVGFSLQALTLQRPADLLVLIPGEEHSLTSCAREFAPLAHDMRTSLLFVVNSDDIHLGDDNFLKIVGKAATKSNSKVHVWTVDMCRFGTPIKGGISFAFVGQGDGISFTQPSTRCYKSIREVLLTGGPGGAAHIGVIKEQDEEGRLMYGDGGVFPDIRKSDTTVLWRSDGSIFPLTSLEVTRMFGLKEKLKSIHWKRLLQYCPVGAASEICAKVTNIMKEIRELQIASLALQKHEGVSAAWLRKWTVVVSRT